MIQLLHSVLEGSLTALGAASLRTEGLSRGLNQNEHLPSSSEGRAHRVMGRSVPCHQESALAGKRVKRGTRGRWLRFRWHERGEPPKRRGGESLHPAAEGNQPERGIEELAAQSGSPLSLLPLCNCITPLRTSSLKYISFHSCIMVPQNPGNPI